MTDAPIIRFRVDRTSIQPGECVTFHWRVEGVQAVYFFREGERWREHGVVGQGEQQVCLSEPATYCLRVIKNDGVAEVRKITVQVQAQQSSQSSEMFSVDREEIEPREGVTFRWHVEGVKAVYFFAEGDRWKQHGVVGHGEQRVELLDTTTYVLRVIRRDDSVDDHKITVRVRAQGGPEAARMFSVDRSAIRPGECVTFRWRVDEVKAVYFHPEGDGWQDHGVPGHGEQQVCPPQTTTYCLRVINRDDSVEIHYITVQVGG